MGSSFRGMLHIVCYVIGIMSVSAVFVHINRCKEKYSKRKLILFILAMICGAVFIGFTCFSMVDVSRCNQITFFVLSGFFF